MLKAYAAYFVAYLIDALGKDILNIERIILFGSVARDTAEKDSDIDIFVELKEKTKRHEERVKKILNAFYQSREAILFKSRGIENKIDLKIGKLSDWKELYRSIASTGIVLYGPYELKELPSGVKNQVIIFWEKIGKNRGAFLNKLYGFKVKGKSYPGLLAKFSGKKIGKSCVMFPAEYKEELFQLLKAYQVEAKIIDIFS